MTRTSRDSILPSKERKKEEKEEKDERKKNIF
jgi:hypothetical protein